MEPLLEVSGLEKRLGTLHLNQISFRVEPGHIAGLVGVNGAVKITLLHTILNLYDKNGGQVTVCGYDMDTQEREAKDRLRRGCQGWEMPGYMAGCIIILTNRCFWRCAKDLSCRRTGSSACSPRDLRCGFSLPLPCPTMPAFF